MNTIQITETIEKKVTNDTGVVKAVNFSIDNQEYAIIFESKADEKHINKEINRYVTKKINSMKDTHMVKIGKYQIICEVVGNERTIYADDEVVSRRKV